MPKPKRKVKNSYMQIRSFSYFVRQALAAVEGMPPELREALGKVIGDLELSQFKDLATLEKALKKMSFS